MQTNTGIAFTASGPVRRRGNFVLLRADTLRLLLSKEEVAAAQHMGSTSTDATAAFSPGQDPAAREVVALSARMQAMAALPADRFLLTQLAGTHASFSFAWNEVRVLIDAELDFHPLPRAMAGEGTVVQAYVQLHDGLALFTRASHLVARAMATMR